MHPQFCAVRTPQQEGTRRRDPEMLLAGYGIWRRRRPRYVSYALERLPVPNIAVGMGN